MNSPSTINLDERSLEQASPEGCPFRRIEGSESSQIIERESKPQSAGVPSLAHTIEGHDQISHIPDELLTLIFIFSLPSGRPPAMAVYEVPLSLTQVCRRWRSLAHSIPELWTSVHLLLAYFRPGAFDNLSEDEDDEGRGEEEPECEEDGDEEDEEQTEEHRLLSKEERILAHEDTSRLPFIQSWFSHTRSTDSLKHLSISDEHIFSNFNSPITDFILDLLDRVECLDLMLCRRTLPRFTEFRPRAYERLWKLRLAGDGFDPGDWTFLLYDAPGLVEFDIRALRSSVMALPLNWRKLTRLAVSYFNDPQDVPSVGVLMEVLKDCLRLESLRMVVRGDDVVEVGVGGVGLLQNEEKQEKIILPNLHTLELEFTYSIKSLFNSLSLPFLTHIQLVEDKSRRYPPVPPTPSNALFHLLSSQKNHGSHDRIQKIEVEAVYYPPSTLIECLQMVPGLKHLVCLAPLSNSDRRVFELDEWLGFDDDVLAALTPGPDSRVDTDTDTDTDTATIATPAPCVLCPNLETLENLDSQSDWLPEPRNSSRTPEAMVRFLRLRSNPSSQSGFAKLKKVVLPTVWAPSCKQVEYAEFCALRDSPGSLDIRVLRDSPGDEDDEDKGAGEVQRGGRLSEGYWSEAWYQA